MPESRMNIYWDACAFLSYINENSERTPVLDGLLHDSANGTINIYTSSLSQVEVAFAASEQQRRALDPEQESKIDSLWNDPDAIVTVEFQHEIGKLARALIRDAIPRGWSLKPLDAVHLATAQWLLSVGFALSEFHTYARGLDKYGQIVELQICRPYTPQPRMI